VTDPRWVRGERRSQEEWDREPVVVGRVSGPYGVRGWLRIESYTQPPLNIVRYSPWIVEVQGDSRTIAVKDGRRHGSAVVALVEGCMDREDARALLGASIAVRRDQLPPLEEDGYYWTDLLGLRVVTPEGVELGRVQRLLETGANDVLVVEGERERLIPFIVGRVVMDVDRERGSIVVSWHPDD
jgi:16S rRNA processing protein RimM